jgi:hypothetical protein
MESQWHEAAEESSRNLDELKSAAEELQLELGVVQAALRVR